jgi:hypothetical protein
VGGSAVDLCGRSRAAEDGADREEADADDGVTIEVVEIKKPQPRHRIRVPPDPLTRHGGTIDGGVPTRWYVRWCASAGAGRHGGTEPARGD